MAAPGTFDPLVLGRRVRDARRRAGWTLAQLGEAVGRPVPYLSQLENGRVEPKLGLVGDVARALGRPVADLVDPEPPTRRDGLEIELARLQDQPAYRALGLAPLRPSTRLSDEVLEHLVALARQLPTESDAAALSDSDRARQANNALRREMRARDNHFPEIEAVAADALGAVGYAGSGPVSERVLTDLAAHFGFTVERVQGMPRSTRSITDLGSRVIFIPQRNDLRTRAARSVVLQTLGHFALGHERPGSFSDYLRQRVESNYFAAAVLAPRDPAVAFLRDAHARGDISVEDLKEVFYLSYEMAAHRITNLATAHLGIPVHFLRTDPEGVILKAYENDGLPIPTDAGGGPEGARVPRLWAARQAWRSSDSFALHYQYTLTDETEFWCVTHLETDGSESAGAPSAITLGTTAEHARSFRGHATLRRIRARREDDQDDPALVARWESMAWPSAAERSHVLSSLPPTERPFTPFPGVDLVEVYRFLDRRRHR